MKKTLIGALLALGLGFSNVGHAAGSTSGNLAVTIIINSGCSVLNGGTGAAAGNYGTLNFGTYSTIATPVDVASSGVTGANMTVECTNGLPFTVSLDGGLNYLGTPGTRQMIAPGVPTSYFLAYTLYQDGARQTLWGNTAQTSTLGGPRSMVGTGQPQDITVFGRVPVPSSQPQSGVYADTVVVTVAW